MCQKCINFDITEQSFNCEHSFFPSLNNAERQPPSFVDFPGNQVVFNDAGLPTAIVTWTEPSVTYTSDPPPTVVSNRRSGDAFPIGLTVVTYTAVDSAGLVTEQDFEVHILGM